MRRRFNASEPRLRFRRPHSVCFRCRSIPAATPALDKLDSMVAEDPARLRWNPNRIDRRRHNKEGWLCWPASRLAHVAERVGSQRLQCDWQSGEAGNERRTGVGIVDAGTRPCHAHETACRRCSEWVGPVGTDTHHRSTQQQRGFNSGGHYHAAS